MKDKTAVVLGAGGFIGTHIVNRLKKEGYFVRGVDIKFNEFFSSQADEFMQLDLTRYGSMLLALKSPLSSPFDLAVQLAADMGGMGYLNAGENDAAIMINSGLINLHAAEVASNYGIKKIMYSSSACIYPKHIQESELASGLCESDAWPANPDSDYGVEKIFSERLYDAVRRNRGIDVRIARFHNVFGEYTLYDGIRAKAPAAICRKVAMAKDGDAIEIWGDGRATRSFLYIDECVEGVMRLIESDYVYPLNVGSNELISVNGLAQMVIDISGKNLKIKNVDGVQGVRGRNSNNEQIKAVLGWAPSAPLREGISKLYVWVNKQVNG